MPGSLIKELQCGEGWLSGAGQGFKPSREVRAWRQVGLSSFLAFLIAFLYVYMRIVLWSKFWRDPDGRETVNLTTVIDRLNEGDFGGADFDFMGYMLAFVSCIGALLFTLITLSWSRREVPSDPHRQYLWLQGVIDDAHREEVAMGVSIILVASCGVIVIADMFYIVGGEVNDGRLVVLLLSVMMYLIVAMIPVVVKRGSSVGVKGYVIALQHVGRLEMYVQSISRLPILGSEKPWCRLLWCLGFGSGPSALISLLVTLLYSTPVAVLAIVGGLNLRGAVILLAWAAVVALVYGGFVRWSVFSSFIAALKHNGRLRSLSGVSVLLFQLFIMLLIGVGPFLAALAQFSPTVSSSGLVLWLTPFVVATAVFGAIVLLGGGRPRRWAFGEYFYRLIIEERDSCADSFDSYILGPQEQEYSATIVELVLEDMVRPGGRSADGIRVGQIRRSQRSIDEFQRERAQELRMLINNVLEKPLPGSAREQDDAPQERGSIADRVTRGLRDLRRHLRMRARGAPVREAAESDR
ncbi:hypothetical protein [Actinomyces capricornis]|uniref:ABC transporter permease n=1 Tax=Actinomyces capricornis TaxID=2755559 RepID=A0ABN6K7P4_9ACTO|nr:hypothetical protein [Actinomyces capricornis]BDA64632.1 hypothetical protein MANAM107_14660 [Actinomyces capricornis]